MSPRPPVVALAVFLGLAIPMSAAGQAYRLVGPDGTVLYTNAPMGPAYQRLGIAPPPAEPPPAMTTARDGGSVQHHVREAASRYGVPERLVNAVIRAESAFNSRAISPKGARGLMQLMPQTASLLGVRDSFDAAENIDGGVRHLRRLIERFGNNLPLALAAYNAGENAVTHYRGIPPYPETQGYVQKVLGLFNDGSGADAALGLAGYPTYHFTDADGTVVYSNVPPPAAVRLARR